MFFLLFFWDKVVKLVGGGSVLNGATPSSFFLNLLLLIELGNWNSVTNTKLAHEQISLKLYTNPIPRRDGNPTNSNRKSAPEKGLVPSEEQKYCLHDAKQPT